MTQTFLSHKKIPLQRRLLRRGVAHRRAGDGLERSFVGSSEAVSSQPEETQVHLRLAVPRFSSGARSRSEGSRAGKSLCGAFRAKPQGKMSGKIWRDVSDHSRKPLHTSASRHAPSTRHPMTSLPAGLAGSRGALVQGLTSVTAAVRPKSLRLALALSVVFSSNPACSRPHSF